MDESVRNCSRWMTLQFQAQFILAWQRKKRFWVKDSEKNFKLAAIDGSMRSFALEHDGSEKEWAKKSIWNDSIPANLKVVGWAAFTICLVWIQKQRGNRSRGKVFIILIEKLLLDVRNKRGSKNTELLRHPSAQKRREKEWALSWVIKVYKEWQ